MRRRSAARQPRHDADRSAEPARLRAPVPDRPGRPRRGDRAVAEDGEPRRPPRHARRQAFRRHAQAAADRAGARAPAAARADGRADGRARPAGAAGALGADRRAALRGDDDPHVDALHRGGAAPRGHRADHVARERGRRRLAVRARDRARGQRRARGLRAAGAARRGRVGGGRRRAAHAAHRHQRGRARRQCERRETIRGRAPSGESRRRLRAADRRGDRLMAARAAGIGRVERPALTGVLVREIVNFSSFWRSTTFSSTVEPTIYFLAFGFGFGSLVGTIGGHRTLDFIATGTVATAVLFSAAFPAMFGTFVKYQFQRTYDAILAAPVDTEALVTAETLWIATRAGLYGCVPLIVAIPFGLDPSWGMLFVPVIAWTAGLGWAGFGIMVAGFAKSFENFNYIVSAVLTPLFLVAGTFFPLSGLPEWGQGLAQLNPLHQCVQLVRDFVFMEVSWVD